MRNTKHIISNKAQNAIYSFYMNVRKKYPNTYDINDYTHNINDVYNSIYQIENGLLRRSPTIQKWQGKGYMANTKKWYFLYRIEEDTIYIEDACQVQNMHENKIHSLIHEYISNRYPLTESVCKSVRMNERELHDMIGSIARRIVCEEYKVVGKKQPFKWDSGIDGESVLTLKDDESGQVFHIAVNDNCYVLLGGNDDTGFKPTTHIFPEAVKALKQCPNFPL